MSKSISFFKYTLIAGFAVATLFSGCKKDDDDDEPPYEFIDQNLQGTLGGQSWTFVHGKYEDNGTEYSIDLYAVFDSTLCDFGWPDGGHAFTTLPKGTGITEFEFGEQTITLYDGTTNYIIIEGAIEIISETNGRLRGRLDAHDGDDNDINGNFEVELCD